MGASSKYLVLNHETGDSGTDDSRQSGQSVGHAHNDAGVLRSNVQLVDAEAGPGESAEADGDRQAGDGGGGRVRESDGRHEHRLSYERRTREYLADLHTC